MKSFKGVYSEILFNFNCFFSFSTVLANELVSKSETYSGIVVETLTVSSGSIVVCANGESTSEASTRLARTLSGNVVEIRSTQSTTFQTVLRMEKPFSSVSAPAIAMDNSRAFGKAEICVTVTKK